jgi:uncharacterized membrane protein YbhN (UPF0104 family)
VVESPVRSVEQLVRSRSGRLVLIAAPGAIALLLVVLAARHFAAADWPLSEGHPALLFAAGVLSLLAYTFKAHGWRRLFAAAEQPRWIALAAASGGASVSGLVLPGRFDDIVRIAIVRRYPGCPAGVRTLCLSLFMLGLIDSAALAPLALAAAFLPGQALGVRIGMGAVAGVGIGAAALVVALPRLLASQRVLRLRLGCWLHPRTTSLRDAAQAWAFVSACWLTRTAGLLLLLGALGVGFSLPLALLFLCTSAAAAALPLGPGGAATQAGAGAAVLVASGAGLSSAVGVAVAVQALGVIAGGSILVSAAAWRTGLRIAPRLHGKSVGGSRLIVPHARFSSPLRAGAISIGRHSPPRTFQGGVGTISRE